LNVRFYYGRRQRFLNHCGVVTILGNVESDLELASCSYRLNGSPDQPVFVDQVSPVGVDTRFEYKQSPARQRLHEPGDFAIDIQATDPALRAGENHLEVRAVDAEGRVEVGSCDFVWDPSEVRLPVVIGPDVDVGDIQQVGMVAAGLFEWDREWGCVRTKAPVRPDSLLVIGGRAGSQEALYEVRVSLPLASKYVGLSDFWLGFEAEDPAFPVRQLWSTAGLATIRPRGEYSWEARIWIAIADAPGLRRRSAHEHGRRRSVVRTDPPVRFELADGQWYQVRHQVLIDGAAVCSRFRIWPRGDMEPSQWLCEERAILREAVQTGPIRPAFSLFQHSGFPTSWRCIWVRELGT
jgi:hypothetical protein